MRVTLATYGSRGDVEPFVALALELKKLGADVTLCIPPDEEFVGLADRFEIATRTFPRAWHSWAEEQTTTAEEHVVSVDDYVRKYIDATFEPLRRAVDGADILIASGMLHFVSGSVAELTGVPYHFVIFAPNLLGSQAWQGAARAPLDPSCRQRSTTRWRRPEVLVQRAAVACRRSRACAGVWHRGFTHGANGRMGSQR